MIKKNKENRHPNLTIDVGGVPLKPCEEGDKPSKYRLEWTHRGNDILYYWDFDNLEQALDYKQLKEDVETIEEIKLYKVVYIEIK